MEFVFIDETTEEEEPKPEVLDGLDLTFEEGIPEKRTLDPEVRDKALRKARKTRKKKAKTNREESFKRITSHLEELRNKEPIVRDHYYLVLRWCREEKHDECPGEFQPDNPDWPKTVCMCCDNWHYEEWID